MSPPVSSCDYKGDCRENAGKERNRISQNGTVGVQGVNKGLFHGITPTPR